MLCFVLTHIIKKKDARGIIFSFFNHLGGLLLDSKYDCLQNNSIKYYKNPVYPKYKTSIHHCLWPLKLLNPYIRIYSWQEEKPKYTSCICGEKKECLFQTTCSLSNKTLDQNKSCCPILKKYCCWLRTDIILLTWCWSCLYKKCTKMFGRKKKTKTNNADEGPGKPAKTGLRRLLFGAKDKKEQTNKPESKESRLQKARNSVRGKGLLGKITGKKTTAKSSDSGVTEHLLKNLKTLKFKKKGKKPTLKHKSVKKEEPKETQKPVKRVKNVAYPGPVNYQYLTPEETWVPGLTADVAKFQLDNKTRIVKFKGEV
eukprot:maker-scaffold_1-snap-gene-19.22-mRNA-1 protein AED:0.16 eAED:0.39 QI:13/0/0.25/0.75/0/0/4/170/312